MTDLNFVIGDATAPMEHGVQIIAHVCNDRGLWGAGFVLALTKAYGDRACMMYKRWHSPALTCPGVIDGEWTPPKFRLGLTQLVRVEDDTYVANMVAQKGFGLDGSIPLQYSALEACLERLYDLCSLHEDDDQPVSVHMPRIGCGLAGGSWDKVEPLIQECLVDREIPVFVYDLPTPQP